MFARWWGSSGRRFLAQLGVPIDKGPETGVSLGIRDLPRETTENHAHKNDGNAPYISLARVIVFLGNDFRRQIRVGTNYAGRLLASLSWVVEDGGRAKIDELDDIIRCHDTIVEFEVTMC
jgi:hypothetical protein